MPEAYNIIAWDARAHGKSVINDDVRFNYRDMIADVLAICRKHNIDSAIFIGQSMGGNLCQDIAYYHPEKVKALVLIDCTRNTAPLTVAEKIGLWMSPLIFKVYPTNLLIRQSAKLCGNTAYTQNYVKRAMHQIGKKRFVEIMNSLRQALHEDEQYKLPCPTLLICGKDDKTRNIIKAMKDWSATDSACTLVWIADAGHASNMDQPKEVNLAIINFLTKLKA